MRRITFENRERGTMKANRKILNKMEKRLQLCYPWQVMNIEFYV